MSPAHRLEQQRQAFIDAEIKGATNYAVIKRTRDGFVRDGRPYVARRYRNGELTGFAMVHDEPAGLAYFDKLFGAARP